MDPVTIIGGATVAFNALKKGFQFGKDLQEMGGQLNQWASSMSDLSYLEQKNKNPPWWKAMGGSVSQQRKAVSAQRMAKGGKIVAAGCGMVDSKRRKKTKLFTNAA